MKSSKQHRAAPCKRSRAEIDQLLKPQENSGLPLATFSRKQGIPPSTFAGWRRRYGKS